MTIRHPLAFVAVFLLLVLSGRASVAQEQESEQLIAGSWVYKTYCQVCHGASGQGDGPLAESLRARPPDLTLLAKKANGKFPREQVERMVDGRNPVKGHGGPDMPVWGDAFKNVKDKHDEADVRKKIKAVVDHLETLQAR